MNNKSIAAVVLAAGKGTRFQLKDRNKVTLHLAGKPIILYAIELLEKLGIGDIFVVVGFAKESIKQVLSEKRITFVDQKEQLGTADALSAVIDHLPGEIQNVLVVNGDDPFHTAESIESLIDMHVKANASVSLTTNELENPSGMGRIVRSNEGNVIAIIEEKDASDKEKKIKEVNSACYLFTIDFLKKYLPKLAPSKITGEYYLTHLITLAAQHGEKIETISVVHKRKGINTPEDLKQAESFLRSSA